MGARHGGSLAQQLQMVDNAGVGYSREQTKVKVIQNNLPDPNRNISARGFAGIGTVYPINAPIDERGVIATATIDVIMSAPKHHYVKFSMTNITPTINLISLIEGITTRFTLDITNDVAMTSITFVPALVNSPTLDLTNGARNILHIVAHRSTTETRYEVIQTGATTPIPVGTVENEHLEWDNSALQWLAVTSSTYGITGPFADSGFLRFANDQIMLSQRNVANDGNLEFKVDTSDFFDFTESNNGPVNLVLRAQDAIDPDQSLTITQGGSATGIATYSTPLRHDFDIGATEVLDIIATGIGLNDLDITDVKHLIGRDSGATSDFRIVFNGAGAADTYIGDDTAEDRINFFNNNLNIFSVIYDTTNARGVVALPTGTKKLLDMANNPILFDDSVAVADADIANDQGFVYFDTATDPGQLFIKKKSTVGVVSSVSLETASFIGFVADAVLDMGAFDIDVSDNALNNVNDINIVRSDSVARMAITGSTPTSTLVLFDAVTNVDVRFTEALADVFELRNSANVIIAHRQFQLSNPADTFQYQIFTSAITTNRQVIFPLLLSNDVFVLEVFAQALSNKTIDTVNNTIIIDANQSTVTNIGASEVEPGLISGQTVLLAADDPTDELLILDVSLAALRRVDINSFLTINDLTNVVITTPADNEVLAFDLGLGQWINQTAAEAGLLSNPMTVDLDMGNNSIVNSNDYNLVRDDGAARMNIIGGITTSTQVLFDAVTGINIRFTEALADRFEIRNSDNTIRLHVNVNAENNTISNVGVLTGTTITATTTLNANGTLFVLGNATLGDADGDAHVMFGDMEIEDKIAPANPADATSVKLFLDSATGELSVQKFSVGTVSLEGGGGSQTPWTSDIDADGFDLADLSNIEFRVTTGAPAASISSIYNDAGGIIIDAGVAETILMRINNALVFTTKAGAIDMGSANQIEFGTTTRFIEFTSVDSGIRIEHPITEQFNLTFAGGVEYDFTNVELDVHANDIARVSLLKFDATAGDGIRWPIGVGNQTEIIASTSSMIIRTAETTDEVLITLDATNVFEFNIAEIRPINIDIELDAGQDLRWTASPGGEPRIGANAGNLEYEIGLIDSHIFKVGTVDQFTVKERIIEMTGNFVSGLELNIFRDDATPNDADVIGQIRFDGRDSNANRIKYATIEVTMTDVTNLTEDARLELRVASGGGFATGFVVEGDNTSSIPRIGFRSATAQAVKAYFVANPTTDRVLNVTLDTLPQVAQVLGTLLQDLSDMGIITI